MITLEKNNAVDLYNQKTAFNYISNSSLSNTPSTYSFVNVFAWKDFFKFDFQSIDGQTCVFAHNEIGVFAYLPPLTNDISIDTIRHCFGYMEKFNKGSGVSRIENLTAQQYAAFNDYEFVIKPSSVEYVYNRKAIADLSGNAFKSKRSEYNQFSNTYESALRSFTEDDLGQCMDLFNRWEADCKARVTDELYLYMLEDNRIVHEELLKNQKQLDLCVKVITVEDQIVAYTAGYQLNRSIFVVLLEVCDPQYKGLPTYVFSEFCKSDELKNFKFINAMDDMGSVNLRRTKLSFRPVEQIPLYTAYLKEG